MYYLSTEYVPSRTPIEAPTRPPIKNPSLKR